MDRPVRSARSAVDQTPTLSFSFDGIPLQGHPGDTLASALLANGVDVVSRSTVLNRPRGVFSAGPEEPNAVVEVVGDGFVEPMVKATTLELFDGLVARSIRGRGRAVEPSSSVRTDKRYHHCDVLVVGGGQAGLQAAAEAAREGDRVLLVEQGTRLGDGRLSTRPADRENLETIRRAAGATVLERATAVGIFDHGAAEIKEQRLSAAGVVRHERLWHVRAKRIVLATGAIERPFVFSDNDRPGVMLADAAREYVTRFGVLPGRRGVLFAGHDGAYGAAADLVAGGVEIALLVDIRRNPPEDHVARLRDLGVEVLTGAAVIGTKGEDRITSALVAELGDDDSPGEPAREIPCDLLCQSAGWVPNLGLYAQAGGKLRYDDGLAAHVPTGQHPTVRVVGKAGGAGLPAAHAHWSLPQVDGRTEDRRFVDLQRDSTVADIEAAISAGLRSPEHIKRYTTIGTGEDQGKTSNLNALGIIATLTGASLDQLQPTTARSPYVPIPFGLMAGRRRGALHDPVRTTPIHDWHVRAGAVFENVGQWKRPRFYPLDGEDMEAATLRECEVARRQVALMDASTLGKIDVQGADSGEFLDRLYTNVISSTPVGACRYGVMCGIDGMVFDDGVVMHVADNHFVTTTTTGGAAAVFDWMEEWRQTEWPGLDVTLTSVTDHWATIAVVGPASRDTLSRLVDDVSLDAESFPFMAIREGTIHGTPVRICRVSFSGELAFEIHLKGRYALAIWEAVFEAGRPYGIAPYGTEALHVLRAEKGYVIVGQDTDGTTTPQDLGMDWIVSGKKEFFVGRRSLRRSDTVRSDRRQLVGLLPEDPLTLIPEGAQLVCDDGPVRRTAGHVTSSYRSAAMGGRTFALALLERGHARHGEVVLAVHEGGEQDARITSTVFYDPEGTRRDGHSA